MRVVAVSSDARERGDKERRRNHCAQCGETIFLPEWSEYLARHRVRHLWECEACGYKFETLVSFAESDASLVP
jgi:ribosomal protein S27AE